MAIDLRSGSSTSYEWAAGSDVGECRTHNEDAYGVNMQTGVFAVADGVGGFESGSRASRIAVNVLTGSDTVDARSPADPFVHLLQYANKLIRAAGREFGSTVVALRLKPPFACVAHVGDCRAALVLPKKTIDRKESVEWLNYTHRLWEQALLNDEPADTVANYRELPRTVVTRALGAGEETDVDLRYSKILPGSLFLLCSDGLWEQLSRADLAGIASNERLDLKERVLAMLQAANDAGGHDNATAMLVRYVGDGT